MTKQTKNIFVDAVNLPWALTPGRVRVLTAAFSKHLETVSLNAFFMNRQGFLFTNTKTVRENLTMHMTLFLKQMLPDYEQNL